MILPMWDWVVIVGCYAFAAFFLRLLGGFGAAGDAIAGWGRRSSESRLRRSGHSPDTYARTKLGR